MENASSTVGQAAVSTIDRMYNDFVTQLLPKIQEGLVITKDYFIDLFGRYIKYLIVTDIIALVAASIVAYIAIRTIKKSIEKVKEVNKENAGKQYWEQDTDGSIPWVILMFISGIATIFSVTTIYDQFVDISKAVFVPEIRVYEEMTDYMNRPTSSNTQE